LSDRVALASGALRGYNLLVLTVDTLRADALGVNGSRGGSTPSLDRLATEGLRFDSAYAHATTTLPSHASLFTGRYPLAHGVRDNGTFRLQDSETTLAETLQGAGYRTGAFVGAFVLDARFGLSQGFDLYDDRYGEESGFTDFNFVERRAEEVLAAAEAWIRREDARPYFAWAHLFDPHAPYEPPSPYREKHASDPYLGEVKYVDSAVGAFLERLRAAGKLSRTLVVVTADHGESLGEHGELTHGAFAYNATLRVPLIFWCPDQVEPGLFRAPVGHVDVTATLLDAFGLDAAALDGKSLLGPGGPGSFEPIYFETLNGFFTQELAPLTGIISGSYKYIDLPIPELYDLDQDPGETQNVLNREPPKAREMKAALTELVSSMGSSGAATQGPVSIDSSTEARLHALGYLGASMPSRKEGFSAEDDPKNQIEVVEMHRTAMERYAAGAAEEAVSLLEEVIRRRPRAIMAHLNLASIRFATGRVDESVATLRKAAAADPGNPRVTGRLGSILAEAGAPADALPLLKEAAEKLPADAEILNSLGVAYARLGQPGEALLVFGRVLALDPSSASAYSNIGSAQLELKHYGPARESFERAIALSPEFYLAHEGLGGVYLETGKLAEAAAAWKEVARIAPENHDTLYNLGMLLVEIGRPQEALPYLERFAAGAPRERYSEDLRRVRQVIQRIHQRSGGGR
jgi:arylsulfatase A-like enzyme/Tfp pilus assembly protein PilF